MKRLLAIFSFVTLAYIMGAPVIPAPTPLSAEAETAADFDIRDFGAIPNIANNRNAIQSALDSARAGKGTVHIPQGTFKYAGTLHVNGVDLVGQGDASVLYHTSRNASAVYLKGDGGSIRNLVLDGKDGSRYSGNDDSGIFVEKATHFEISRVTIKNSAAAGIHLSGAQDGTVRGNHLINTGADGIHIANFRGQTKNVVVEDNVIEWIGKTKERDGVGDDGIAVVSYDKSPDLMMIENIVIKRNTVKDQPWGAGYTVLGGRNISLVGNLADNRQAAGNSTYAGLKIMTRRDGPYPAKAIDGVEVKGNRFVSGGQGNASIIVSNPTPDANHYIKGVVFTDNYASNPQGDRLFSVTGDAVEGAGYSFSGGNDGQVFGGTALNMLTRHAGAGAGAVGASPSPSPAPVSSFSPVVRVPPSTSTVAIPSSSSSSSQSCSRLSTLVVPAAHWWEVFLTLFHYLVTRLTGSEVNCPEL